MQAAPTRPEQGFTSGEFQNQFEIFISYCKTGNETSFQTGIYATTRFSEAELPQQGASFGPDHLFQKDFLAGLFSVFLEITSSKLYWRIVRFLIE